MATQRGGLPIPTGPRVIVGIDYGTTFSAIAYSRVQNAHTVPTVEVVRRWPVRDTVKVPSVISYSDCTCAASQCKQWGYNMCQGTGKGEDQNEVMQWTKLELPQRSTQKELEALRDMANGLSLVTDLHNGNGVSVPLHLTRSPEDVVKDFVYKIGRKWHQDMKAANINVLSQVDVDLIMTHPADWPYEALNKTYRAINGALRGGLIPKLRDIYLSSEPEACALNTVQEILAQDRHLLVIGECFVLCDAGGGTVDVASYRIDSLNPLRLTGVGGISGVECGATLVDRAFLIWIQQRLLDPISRRGVRPTGPLELNRLGRRVLDQFQQLKHNFNGRNGGEITVPGTVKLAPGQTEIVDGVATLSPELMKSFFKESVDETVELIKQQVAKIQNSDEGSGHDHVANVFLAGGFAESDHLFNEIKLKYTDRKDISLFRAADCWGGVVKGAVLRAAGRGMPLQVKAASCPRHYGICISRRQNKSLDRITWLVRQGDLIPSDDGIKATLVGQVRISTMDLFQAKLARVVFIATDMVNPPMLLSKIDQSANEVVHLTVDDVPPTAGSKRYLDVQVEILQSIRVRVKCGTHTVASYDTNL